jgi:hypothetical protein
MEARFLDNADTTGQELGQCPCGNQTHEIVVQASCCGLIKTPTRVPISEIPGLVANGLCLVCHPQLAFSETGGECDAAEVTDGGRGFGTTKSPADYCHAATAALLPGQEVTVKLAGSKFASILQLVPADKDIGKTSSMANDMDTWGISCHNGWTCFGGQDRTYHGAAAGGDLVTITHDASSVTFVKNGAPWAQISGVELPAPLKFMATTGYENSVVLLQWDT